MSILYIYIFGMTKYFKILYIYTSISFILIFRKNVVRIQMKNGFDKLNEDYYQNAIFKTKMFFFCCEKEFCL